MESQARFLNIKASRFKEDYRHGQSLPQTPSANDRGLQHSPSLTTNFSHPAPLPLLNQPSKIAKITRFLSQQRGAHHPLQYHSSFGFSEKWQALSKEIQGREMGFMQTTGWLQWASFALFPFLVVQLWFVTVFRVFRYDSDGWMWPAGLALELLCLLQKGAVIVGQLDFKGGIGHQLCALFNRERTIATGGNVYALCYYCVALGTRAEGKANLALFLFDLLLICYKYLTLEEIYSGIRIEAVGGRYKVFMSLFDLFSNVLLMIHVFAVLLYLCTYASPESNWHLTSPIDSMNNWIGDYIEAFYFACTTMLTVGFGDIRPTNLLEVLCILIVQLVGVLNNAYVINEIGANLSLIHQRRNTLEKDIANAQKIVHFNRMSQQTRTRMLDYLMRNQVANEELSIADEEALLDKLSQQFKREIKQDSQLRAVKKNVFLLANFSRRFQNEVSKRLVKAIYPPHCVLANNPGRQRLFIISKGAVDIVTQKKYNNRAFAEKVVKSIEVKQCADNNNINATYGFACLFSGRPSRIKAVAKNFVVCYYLEHQDVVQCMGRSTDDFERYFEIKHRIELLPIPEMYEIPNIISKREHYCPNIFYLIKKERKSKHSQSRRYVYRSQRRLFKVHEKFQEELGAVSASINESTDSFPSTIIEEAHQQPLQLQQHPSHQRKITPLSNFCPQMLANLNTPLIAKPRAQQQTRVSGKQYMQIRRVKLQEKSNAQLNLEAFNEACKEYRNYYPKGNLTPIVEKYNKRLRATNQMESDSVTSSRLALLKSKRKRIESNISSSL